MRLNFKNPLVGEDFFRLQFNCPLIPKVSFLYLTPLPHQLLPSSPRKNAFFKVQHLGSDLLLATGRKLHGLQREGLSAFLTCLACLAGEIILLALIVELMKYNVPWGRILLPKGEGEKKGLCTEWKTEYYIQHHGHCPFPWGSSTHKAQSAFYLKYLYLALHKKKSPRWTRNSVPHARKLQTIKYPFNIRSIKNTAKQNSKWP